jgi:hypothetical protein
MMTTVALLTVVIMIEAVPVYRYLRAGFRGEAMSVDATMVGAFAIVVLICVLATLIPLKVGLRRMEGFEF